MSWDAITGSTEVLGTLAVLITLFYCHRALVKTMQFHCKPVRSTVLL